MNTRHKHADIICAWANGAKIQIRETEKDEWQDLVVTTPAWCGKHYRIKPSDIIKYAQIHYKCGTTRLDNPGRTRSCADNVKMTFDYCGKLTSIEMIK